MIATGDPKRLLLEYRHPTVRNFLTRGDAGAEEIPGVSTAPCFLA